MIGRAFVTLLMLNDSYLPGVLVLAYALRKQKVNADIVCMVTEDISDSAKECLAAVFDRYVIVPTIFVPHKRRQKRQDRPFWFTKFNVLRLGKDGDLGCDYEKLVLLDADVLPLRNFDALFSVKAPAGILNEDKSKLMYLDSRDRSVLTKWSWHDTYDLVAPHGSRIPKAITDQVATDPTNMGLNGSLFVIEPSMAEFRAIMEDVKRPEVKALVSDQFALPDMQYITMRWSGQWHSVDIKYSAYNGYPRLAVLNGTHFAGVKPWYFKREPKTTLKYSRYDDFQLWYRVYLEMMVQYPELEKSRKLSGLSKQAAQVRAA